MNQINKTPFKTRIKEELKYCAQLYKSLLMDYEYLICSSAFKEKPYYVFYATKDNFLHLTGVHTELKASVFFYKCLHKTITEDDFDFLKPNQTEKAVKGCVREKLKVFPQLGKILLPEVLTEEQFTKGNITCSFATATNSLTIGFVTHTKSRPKTLLKGNHLKHPQTVDLILRKPKDSKLYTDIIIGNNQILQTFLPDIIDLVSDKLTK